MPDFSNIFSGLGIDPNAYLNANGFDAGQPGFQPPQVPAPQLPVQNSVVPGILAQLQQQNGAAPNVLQALNPPQPAPSFASDPNAVAPQPSAQPAAPVAPPAPRKRLSLLDAIGKTADVLAKVGGAAPLYQSTLDENTARQLAAEDHARAVVSNTLANAHTQQEIDASKALTGKTAAETEKDVIANNAAKYGAALRGLQAIQKANPQADVSTIWPILAKQAGIDDAGSQQLLGVIQQNPGSIDGLAAEYEKQKAGSGEGNFGLNPFLATDGHGNVKGYQLGKDGTLHEISLPAGFQPATTTSIVDTGDHQIVTDKRTGNVIRTFSKSGGPEKGETPILDAKGNVVAYSAVPGSNLQYKRDNPGGKNGSLSPSEAFGSYTKARTGLLNLANGLEELAKDPGLASATGTSGTITSHLPAGLGGADTQRILQKIETLKGRAIPSALNTMRDASGKLGFRPSQVEVLGDAKGLLGALDQRKVSHDDYVKALNDNRALILQQIRQLDAEAQRTGVVVQGEDGKIRAAPPKAAAPSPALPPRVTLTPKPKAGGQPTVSNW